MTDENENTVFVGKKPTMNYVLAVVTQFNSGSPEIIIKARGRAISRAVDVAEIVRHRFVSDATIRDIIIDTEPLTTEEGPTVNVSSIEIILGKKEKVEMEEKVEKDEEVEMEEKVEMEENMEKEEDVEKEEEE